MDSTPDPTPAVPVDNVTIAAELLAGNFSGAWYGILTQPPRGDIRQRIVQALMPGFARAGAPQNLIDQLMQWRGEKDILSSPLLREAAGHPGTPAQSAAFAFALILLQPTVSTAAEISESLVDGARDRAPADGKFLARQDEILAQLRDIGHAFLA
jgi:hypothetical protein